MSIFYLIIDFFVFTSFFLYKKSSIKLNAITWFIFTLVFMLCYRLILFEMMSLIRLPINLFTYCIISIIISAYLFCKIFKKGKRQEYIFRKIELIGFILIIIYGIYLGISYFGLNLEIKFETTDPSVHYFASKCFMNSDSLLSFKNNLNSLYNLKGMMPIHYCNAGFFMKAFSSFFSEITIYKVFIAYSIYSLVIALSIFYAMIIKFLTNYYMNFIAILAILFFGKGYPYNEMIFGFGYLGNTIIVICSLFIILQEFNNSFIKETDDCKWVMLVTISALAFSIFFGYYFFVPVVYGSLFFYFIYYFMKNKMLFTKWFWITGIITLLIPTFLGFIQYFLPSIKALLSDNNSAKMNSNTEKKQLGQISALAMEGYIYRDLYSNLLYFIPFSIFMVINSIRKRKLNFDFYILILSVIFTILIFFLGMVGKASSYYYYKNYYLLSPILFYNFIYTVYFAQTEYSKLLINSLIFTFCGTFAMNCINFDTFVVSKNSLFNVDPKLSKLFDIYVMNNIYKDKGSILTNEEIELIFVLDGKLKDNLESDYKVVVLGNTNERLWFYSLTGYIPNLDESSLTAFYEENITLDNFKDNKNIDFVLILNESNDLSSFEMNDYEIIYGNKSGIILKSNIS